MPSKSKSSYPRTRTLMHPGPFSSIRIKSMQNKNSRHFRFELNFGMSLFDALTQPLKNLSIKGASVTILGGYFENIQYCLPGPDPSGAALMAYSTPKEIHNAYMIFGNATIGKKADGSALVHCHAAVVDKHGKTQGGHIITDKSFIGKGTITVLLTSLEGFELHQVWDEETNLPLLQPCKEQYND